MNTTARNSVPYDSANTMVGEKIKKTEWIHGSQCVVRVEVDAIRPADDRNEVYFEPATIRHLERLQRLADEGKVDELAEFGVLYIRRSA